MFLEESNDSSSKMEKATDSFDKIMRLCTDYQRAQHKGTKWISTQTPAITAPPERYLTSLRAGISKMIASSPEARPSAQRPEAGLFSGASRRTEPTFVQHSESKSASTAKKAENQNPTPLDLIREDVTNALISKEQLKMARMVRLRLSFAAGNQVGEASQMATDYYLKYQKEKKTKEMTVTKLKSLVAKEQFGDAAELTIKEKLGREDINGMGKKFKKALADLYDKMDEEALREKNSTPAVSEKQLLKSQFLEAEAEELSKKINEAHSHMHIHRRMDKKTMGSINGSNVRLVSLYKIVEPSLNMDERNALLKKIEEINGEIEKLAKTANGFGQKLKVSTSVVLEDEKLETLKKAFNESADSTDFSLILMNDINQKDIYQYFKFLDKQGVFIGEFMLAIIELKSLKNGKETIPPEPQEDSRNPSHRDNVHPFPARNVSDNTDRTPPAAKSSAPETTSYNPTEIRPVILEEAGENTS